jgi:protein phosphatase
MICPVCGTDNRSDARFCRKCGATLQPRPAPVAVTAPEPGATRLEDAPAPAPDGADGTGPAAAAEAPAPEAPAAPETPAAPGESPPAPPDSAALAAGESPPAPPAPAAAEDTAPPAAPPLDVIAAGEAAVPVPDRMAEAVEAEEEEERSKAGPVVTPPEHTTPAAPGAPAGVPASPTAASPGSAAEMMANEEQSADTALAPGANGEEQAPEIPAGAAAAAIAGQPPAPPAPPPEAEEAGNGQEEGDPMTTNNPADDDRPRRGSRPTRPLAETEVVPPAPPSPADPFPPLDPGTLVGDRYQVLQVLQTGPQHQTYLATDQAAYQRCWACGSTDNIEGEIYCNDCGAQLAGRQYRLYELPPGAPPPRLPETLLREHVPGVAQIHDSLKDAGTGRHYLVLEEVSGQSLSAWGSGGGGTGPPTLEAALNVLLQVADLLAALHKADAVGCDFGPQSLLILPDDRLMLADPASCEVAGRNGAAQEDEFRADVQRVAAALEQWYHALPGLAGNPAEDAPTATLGPGDETPAAPPPGKEAQTLDEVLAYGRAGAYPSAEAFAAALRELLEAEVPPRDLQLSSGRATDVGVQRQLNEDSVLALEVTGMEAAGTLPAGVYIVADGMGGHEGGEVASSIAIRTIGGLIQQQVLAPLVVGEERPPSPEQAAQLLRDAILEANRRIARLARERRSDMGTTVTMALIVGNHATVANVGDSRTYLWRDGKLQQISQDHSLVARLIAAGQLTAEQGRHFDRRNEIYRALGDEHLLGEEIDVYQRRLRPFDALVLCSDGLWEMIRDQDIERIMLAAPDLSTACAQLVAAANRAGGEDNISVIIVQAVSGSEG